MVRSPDVAVDKGCVHRASSPGVELASVIALFQDYADVSRFAGIGVTCRNEPRIFYFFNILRLQGVHVVHCGRHSVYKYYRRSSVYRESAVYRICLQAGKRKFLE